jgi:hypothetical protein
MPRQLGDLRMPAHLVGIQRAANSFFPSASLRMSCSGVRRRGGPSEPGAQVGVLDVHPINRDA